jgi:hypothetical protein
VETPVSESEIEEEPVPADLLATPAPEGPDPDAISEPPLEEAASGPPAEAPLPTSDPEVALAARVLPPEPRPRAATERAVFFDVENTSRAEHIERVLAHLALDWTARTIHVIAVGNWRVVGHETARLLARHGAQLVHSAPSVGVRDWSDLRIAVAAGVWLAGARPGDVMDIVSDDQAFDAVGDVAASLGIVFHRLSYRALAGLAAASASEEPVSPARSRRRRRGGRGRTARRPEAAPADAGPGDGRAEAPQGHTAPHDELLAVVRELAGATPERGVSIDAVSNALKARGFSRPPGSHRLITRLRRLKELDVSRNGTIRLLAAEPADHVAESADEGFPVAGDAPEADEQTGGAGATDAPRRRRRRRGGRRRRGRGRGTAAAT